MIYSSSIHTLLPPKVYLPIRFEKTGRRAACPHLPEGPVEYRCYAAWRI